MRALIDVERASRGASGGESASPERATLAGLAQRAHAAVVALGEDYRALSEEALPAPAADIDRGTVARVLFVFMEEAARRTGSDVGQCISAVVDAALIDLLAVRASALPVPDSVPAAAPRRRRK